MTRPACHRFANGFEEFVAWSGVVPGFASSRVHDEERQGELVAKKNGDTLR